MQYQMSISNATNVHPHPLVKKIVEAYEKHDNGKQGFKGCSIALFGEPGTGKFEFVLSGRHVTRRCDGDAVDGAAFGGPIFYGHAAKSFNEPADHAGNIYWYQAVRAKGIPTAYLAFEGEQHGFRQAANIKRALDAEFYFFSRVFGFTPADILDQVEIDNL